MGMKIWANTFHSKVIFLATKSSVSDCILPVSISILGYRQILQADASVVDLNKLGPYYYDLGRKLCDLEVIRERDEIQKALIEAYGVRFRTIMDASQNIMRVCNDSLVVENILWSYPLWTLFVFNRCSKDESSEREETQQDECQRFSLKGEK